MPINNFSSSENVTKMNVYVTKSISKVNPSIGLRKLVVIIHKVVLPSPNGPDTPKR